jgi:hypothetical protein
LKCEVTRDFVRRFAEANSKLGRSGKPAAMAKMKGDFNGPANGPLGLGRKSPAYFASCCFHQNAECLAFG